MRTFAVAIALFIAAAAYAQTNVPSWLDRPLTNWNAPGRQLPAAPGAEESTKSVIARCKLTPPAATAGEKALATAGWITFWNFDRQLLADGVEVVGGMRGADGM